MVCWVANAPCLRTATGSGTRVQRCRAQDALAPSSDGRDEAYGPAIAQEKRREPSLSKLEFCLFAALSTRMRVSVRSRHPSHRRASADMAKGSHPEPVGSQWWPLAGAVRLAPPDAGRGHLR